MPSHLTPCLVLLLTTSLLASCAGFDPTQPDWRVVSASPQTNNLCVLYSKPETISTTAGSDNIIISINNKSLVSIVISQENLRIIKPEAVSVFVDNHAPVAGTELLPNGQGLRFNVTQSEQLIAMFSEGKYANVKLGLPTQRTISNPKLSLKGFRQALTDLRLCNVFHQPASGQ